MSMFTLKTIQVAFFYYFTDCHFYNINVLCVISMRDFKHYLFLAFFNIEYNELTVNVSMQISGYNSRNGPHKVPNVINNTL